MTVPQMAEKLGVSISSATNKLKRLNLSYASSVERLQRMEMQHQIEEKNQSKQQAEKLFAARGKHAALREEAAEKLLAGLKAFHSSEKERAVPIFQDIIDTYASEIDICNTARSYIAYLESLNKTINTPKTTDQRIAEAIVYMELDNLKEAHKVLRGIYKTDPHNAYNLFLMACIYARENNSKRAIKYLKDAIKQDEHIKSKAIKEVDLDPLRDTNEFKKLIHDKLPACCGSRPERLYKF